MDKRTDEKSDGTHALPLTSLAWQQQIDDTNADIAGKTARLMMMGHAKGEALTDHKKLAALEIEEARLPTEVTALKKRLPLLADELERALKDEAKVRYEELARHRAEAATGVTQSSREIRAFMAGLLECITEAHASWQGEAQLAAEARYLSLRFALPAQQIAPGTRLTPEEARAFTRQYERQLRRPLDTRPWDARRSDFQAAQRREEERRQAAEDAARPNVPLYTHWIDGKPLAARRH